LPSPRSDQTGTTMKAMVYRQYGSPDSLELAEVDPPCVREDEVLVKVRAASVNWLDWYFLIGRPFMTRLMAGLLDPKNRTLGIDLAGQVVEVGKKATRFHVDDEVFGSTTDGCLAEYVAVKEDEIELKPSVVPFDEAAGVGATASTALHGLRDAGPIKPGDRILVNGASGGVGTFAAQIARVHEAEVTGTCSAINIDLVRSLGADDAVDYKQEDFTQAGQRYDLIFDCAATRTFSECRRVLNPKGRYVTTEFSPELAFQAWWISFKGDRRMVPLVPRPPTREDLKYLRELLEAEKIRTVIDRRFALGELPEALCRLEQGHTPGKIIIAI
jgi:NADPH:quinone reductase-like Zn-dependent oxidoreductase